MHIEKCTDDKKEFCGIFGVFGHERAVELAYLGLYSLQHRGEESCGIAVTNGGRIDQVNGMGLVPEVFDKRTMGGLKGSTAIGHVRYSTTGSSIIRNAQPFVINHYKLSVAIGHNGNLTNAVNLRRSLERKGAIFQTTMDSEIILHLLVRSKKTSLVDKLVDALKPCGGAYSLVMLADDKLVGIRDPYGFKPLCIGMLDGAYVFASETCALDIIGAVYLRDVDPGEIVVIDDEGIRSYHPFDTGRISQCIFEYIYFSRPDSRIYGDSVYLVRERLGMKLAEEHPVEADLVMSIPDSGNYAALGYSKRSGIPFEFGMIRNHYVGRTFIQPSQEMRDHGVRVKLNPIAEVLRGKKIIVVEDSIVRGTTTGSRIRALREAGAREIHMRISCPPIKFPCFYGIDFPNRKELIANNKSIGEIADFIGVDTLKYLSLDRMIEAAGQDMESFCTACFSGTYPTKLNKDLGCKCSMENNGA